MAKTKYMENVPTTLLVASTACTKILTALGISAPFLLVSLPAIKITFPGRNYDHAGEGNVMIMPNAC
jgi:hypothetical protein